MSKTLERRTTTEANGNGNGRAATPQGLDASRLAALQAHRDFLRRIADEARPYTPRQVSAPELREWASAVDDLLGELNRLRAAEPGRASSGA